MTTARGHVDYGYGPTNGPHTWCLTCHAAAGARQSPINIIRHNCIYDSKLSPLRLFVFHNSTQLFTRKKHNFQVSFKSSNATTIEGGPLKGKYNLQQFHCHWGCEDEWGSEHHVDGHSFAGELHLVFMSEKYSTMDRAVKDSEGLCVIGVFLKANRVECEAMRPLISAIKSSKPSCEQPIADEIDLHSLIPSMDHYFTYEGSLTTPPCAECVRWIVCAEPLKLSKDQLAAMRSMHSCESCNTTDNFRPPLPVGNRQRVFTSSPIQLTCHLRLFDRLTSLPHPTSPRAKDFSVNFLHAPTSPCKMHKKVNKG
ncbi:carbonic anhydrase II [Echinococcus multilocularis]|uniref:Carbonic anhydrase n=1 Tax=Echinococcus multilocularis TaxID=6211 RepID=A0A068Y7B2_ECHMU|nr:carbonic anhydrase II [Echinococcus multilocularis]